MIKGSLAHIIALLFVSTQVEAQRSKCPEIPQDYSWSSAADYKKDSAFVVDCLRWLSDAPLYKNLECRSRVNLYVLEWLAGTPHTKLEVNSKYLPFTNENPELLFSFIHGMALYQLENANCKDSGKLHREGLKTVALLVEREEDMKRSKELRQLMRMSDNDKKLNKYLEKQFPAIEKKE